MMSPLRIRSPSFFSHRLRIPSVIVSDRRGIWTSGMAGLLPREASVVEDLMNHREQRGSIGQRRQLKRFGVGQRDLRGGNPTDGGIEVTTVIVETPWLGATLLEAAPFYLSHEAG